MIGKPTVLILGAGASVDYDFPTGRKLLLKICKDASPAGPLFEFLKDTLRIESREIGAFRQNLQDSHAPSVDFFLEKRPEFESIGKRAIAATLMPCEKREAFQLSDTRNWYETLFHLMVDGGRFEDNKLSIITFNYDRSLETFLFLSLRSLYGIDVETALERLASIQIVHVYGSLGTNIVVGGSKRGYQPELTEDWVETAAGNIKIVHEAETGADLEKAYNLLCNAVEIIFLGFGFHPINLQRLRLEEAKVWRENLNLTPPRWVACRTQMGDGEILRAQNHVRGIPLEFAPDKDWTIYDFLSNANCLMPT